MTDSRDQPELETLSYKPEHAAIINRYGKKRSRVKQPTQQECDAAMVEGFESTMKKNPIIPEQPNQNLMVIEEIEGLMSQVNEKIHKLTFSHDSSDVTKKQTLWSQAIEEIDIFQKTTLFDLRKACE